MYSPCIHRQYVSSIVCHPTYTLYELLTTWWSLLTTTDHVPAHQVTAPYQTAIQIDLTHNTTLNVSDPHRTNTFYTNLPTIIVISLSVVNSYYNLIKILLYYFYFKFMLLFLRVILHTHLYLMHIKTPLCIHLFTILSNITWYSHNIIFSSHTDHIFPEIP